ncbi:MAG: Smr/MutS family protein, partial [Desulfovibrionaceae bacterium]
MANKRLKSLADLKELQMELQKEQPGKAPEHAPEPPKPKPRRPAKRFGLTPQEKRQLEAEQAQACPEDEEQIFARAMQGVNPLNPGLKGRELQPEPEPAAPRFSNADQAAVAHLNDLVAGDLEFEIEYSDEYMHGKVKGVDAKAFNQLKAGALAVDAHLDLHGLNADQARDSLLFFVHECYLQNKRCLLLVPGRGKNSP